MRRSDFYIKLISAVLFIAVLSYIGVYVYKGVINSYQTAPAVACTVEETGSAEGFIIREETILSDMGVSALPVVGEGEKVARNQTVAVGYKSESALETASEIHEIRLRINQLEEAAEQGSSGGIALASTGVLELSRAVHSGLLTELEALSLRIESYIFSKPSDSGELPGLRERLIKLESQNTGTLTVTAPESGVFSSVTDGFEEIGPDALEGVTPSRLEEMFAGYSEGGSASGAIGKLITGIKWYYAAVMDDADAACLPAGGEVSVIFTGAYQSTLQMTVERIGRSEDGLCVVLLAGNSNISEIAPLRFLRAEVILNSTTGVRVPKEAIHLGDNGETFVYLETAGRSEQVEVKIIGELGDGYLVESGAESGTALRAGALIIVKANGLSGGKAVPR